MPTVGDDAVENPNLQVHDPDSGRSSGDAEAKTPLEQDIAKLLHGDRRQLLWNQEALAHRLNTSRRNLKRYLHAVAEVAVTHERSVLSRILETVRLLQEGGAVEPLLFVHGLHYDETQMTCHIGYGDSEGSCQRHKVLVITQEWNILLRRCSGGMHNYLTIRGSLSPCLKAGQNATGETIAKILEDVGPKQMDTDFFKNVVRVVETDEGSNNYRAESILGHLPRLHLMCAGHKIHEVCRRVWTLFPELKSAMVQTIKFLKSPGAFDLFQTALLNKLSEPGFVVINDGVLDEEAHVYREIVMAVFTPRTSESRTGVAWIRVLARTLLNGDWRKSGVIEHRCAGNSCCPQGRPETLAKLRIAVPNLLKRLRLQRFELGNWKHWHRHCYFVGFLVLTHRLFSVTYVHAFGGHRQDDARSERPSAWNVLESHAQGGEELGADHSSVQAGELAKMLKASLKFWNSPSAATQLYIVGVTLEPQVQMMAELLENVCGHAEAAACTATPGSGCQKCSQNVYAHSLNFPLPMLV